tara:strand:+ start:13845 stop:14672 length:828 start_codon:yes stop_codon:yes gene_type:complete
MKFGFVTCVELGLSCMEAIYAINGKLDLAITLLDSQAKQKSGRVYLDRFCSSNSIPLVKSDHINNREIIDAVNKHNIDWLFIIGWSQIASQELLDAPNKGAIGIHPTLLPVGRGRAAIPWAILKGLDKTGVTMFKLDEGVDTGPILDQVEIPLYSDSTATSLYEEVNSAHIDLIKQAFPLLAKEKLALKVQDSSKATEWPGRKPDDGLIKLEASVHEAERMVRALASPYPGAFSFVDGKKIIIDKAEIVEVKDEETLYLQFFDGLLKCTVYRVLD